jgi:hypothetical protein
MFSCDGRRRILLSMLAGALVLMPLLTVLPATAAQPDHAQGRNFDARIQRNIDTHVKPTPAQRAAEQSLRNQAPGLAVAYDRITGAAARINNHSGYVSGPQSGTPGEIALGFAQQHRGLLGLTPGDLESVTLQDEVFSAVSGASHLYYLQTYQGIPLYNGQLHVNVNRQGRVLSLNNAFVPAMAQTVNTHKASLSAAEALDAAAGHLGQSLGPVTVLEEGHNARQTTRLAAPSLSLDEVEAKLYWLSTARGETRLVWNFQVQTLDRNHWYDINVDAVDGTVWTRFDWANSAAPEYNVYAEPDESPLHGTQSRTLKVDPANLTASPLRWHDDGTNQYTITRGNNVYACHDQDANNSCSTNTDCGPDLHCNFAIDLGQQPANYVDAAVANLFYWNNLIHDTQYAVGFDEAGGNFQENNFANGGVGGDSVNADAQDGSGNCNANFATPTDGGNPRMQMFLCSNVTPSRDGDVDNGVIVHEYGHGISIRQVGGPGNSSCLNNTQQAGEGWSDWFGLVYTAEPGDLGTDSRGIGTYLFGQAPDGPGIRDLPYSTDPAVNNWTYESINGAGVPHGVGSRWAQAIWEVYWALVDQHGSAWPLQDFDINNPNEAGNRRALYYINEGLKNTACSPTFTDNRDGIIQAATDSFGGEDVCLLWDTFAAYGLGTDAVSGGSSSLSPTNGFDTPLACQCQPSPIADAGPDQLICLNDSTTVGTPAQPDNSYSWAPGGETTAQITVAPTVDTTYTVTATTAACGSDADSATIFVDSTGNRAGLSDDLEGSVSGWTTSGLWHLTNNSACASPGYSSATHAFYYGQDATCDYSTGAATSGTLTSPVILGVSASSTLSFDYYRVVESFSGDYDRTSVDVVTESGRTTVFSLNSSNASTAAWVSSGSISLAAFAGQAITLEFKFDSVDSVSNTFTGWFIDDVVVTGQSPCTGPVDTPPVVTITAPADGSTFTVGDLVTFTGTATDAEDGDLSGSLNWTSSIDGALGSGASVATSGLSVGVHSITAEVTDSGSNNGSDVITVTINAVPTDDPPVVTITAPADGSSFTEGDTVTFVGTAIDDVDGDISSSISWSSSLDGGLGTGASVATSALSVGTHTITAQATDSATQTGSDSISVTINAAPTNITLSASGVKVKGIHTNTLNWSGATSANVDILRNGAPLTTTANDGNFVDDTGNKGKATYTYQVCEAGTSTCSNIATVVF